MNNNGWHNDQMPEKSVGCIVVLVMLLLSCMVITVGALAVVAIKWAWRF